jgi:hypothetical protein
MSSHSNAYRAPEMDPRIPMRGVPADERRNRSEGAAALFFAAALMFGIGLLYLSSAYAPSNMTESQAPQTYSAPPR